MIANITYGNNMYGLLLYNENKEKGDSTLLYQHNILAESFDERLTGLKAYCDKRKDLKYTTTHISLSFHKNDEDLLDEETCINIATEYMSEFNYGDQPYIVYRHTDTEHPHLHIVAPKITKEGKSLSQSSDRFIGKNISRLLEEKHSLVKAEEQKKLQNENESPKSTKKELFSKLKQIKGSNNFSSIDEFHQICVLNGVDFVHHSGTIEEVEWEGLTYYLLDEKEKRKSGIKASSLSNEFTLPALRYSMSSHQKQIKKKKYKTKNKVERLLKKYISVTISDFKEAALEQNLEIVISQGKKGIFGLSVYDKEQGIYQKFSELNRELSWNKLKELFSGETYLKKEQSIIQKALNRIILQEMKSVKYRSLAIRNLLKNTEEISLELMNHVELKDISFLKNKIQSCFSELEDSYSEQYEKDLNSVVIIANHLEEFIKEGAVKSNVNIFSVFDFEEETTKYRNKYFDVTIEKEDIPKEFSMLESAPKMFYTDKYLIGELMGITSFNKKELLPFELNYNKLRTIIEDNFLNPSIDEKASNYLKELLTDKEFDDNEKLFSYLSKIGFIIEDTEGEITVSYLNSGVSLDLSRFKMLPSEISLTDKRKIEQLNFNLNTNKTLSNLRIRVNYYRETKDLNNYVKTSNSIKELVQNNSILKLKI